MPPDCCSLEKSLWNTEDFPSMGWHDSTIHAIRFVPDSFEFLLDIDYIVKWINPEPGEVGFRFCVAPATLVFENVSDLHLDLSDGAWTILDLRREEIANASSESVIRASQKAWLVDCVSGEIAFRSTGFSQYFRRAPKFLETQSLEPTERGGISFDKVAFTAGA